MVPGTTGNQPKERIIKERPGVGFGDVFSRASSQAAAAHRPAGSLRVGAPRRAKVPTPEQPLGRSAASRAFFVRFRAMAYRTRRPRAYSPVVSTPFAQALQRRSYVRSSWRQMYTIPSPPSTREIGRSQQGRASRCGHRSAPLIGPPPLGITAPAVSHWPPLSRRSPRPLRLRWRRGENASLPQRILIQSPRESHNLRRNVPRRSAAGVQRRFIPHRCATSDKTLCIRHS